MQLTSIERKKKKITHSHNFMNREGKWTERKDSSPELPKPSFNHALQALTAVIGFVQDVPKEFLNQCIPYKLLITRTKSGTKSAQIFYNRIYEELGTELKEKTPIFRIDQPEEGESGVVIFEKKDRHLLKLVVDVMNEAEAYIKGEREQLTFDEKAEEKSVVTTEEETNVLDFKEEAFG